jgi:hypothetical protein
LGDRLYLSKLRSLRLSVDKNTVVSFGDWMPALPLGRVMLRTIDRIEVHRILFAEMCGFETAADPGKQLISWFQFICDYSTTSQMQSLHRYHQLHNWPT